MLRYYQMAKVTPRAVIDRARGIRYRLVAYTVHASLAEGPRIEYRVSAISQQSGGLPGRANPTRMYDVLIKQYATKRESFQRGFTPQKRTWVHCSCPFFLFTCEVALARRGSSAVVNSNGKPPRKRNPRMVPLMCKHLAAVGLKGFRIRLTDKRLSKVFGDNETWSRALFQRLSNRQAVSPEPAPFDMDAEDRAILAAFDKKKSGRTLEPTEASVLAILDL